MLVSRYFGARDYGKMKTIVSTSLISFLILSIRLGVFGAALATLIAQGISAVFSLLIFFTGYVNIKVPFTGLTGSCKSIWYTGACRLCGNDESRECFFTDICVNRQCRIAVCFPESWGKEN